MTTITAKDREILEKLKLQHWDIDEGDLSIYRHVDDRHVHLAEIDDPAETARELAFVWRIATSLLDSLEAAEARAEKAEVLVRCWLSSYPDDQQARHARSEKPQTNP